MLLEGFDKLHISWACHSATSGYLEPCSGLSQIERCSWAAMQGCLASLLSLENRLSSESSQDCKTAFFSSALVGLLYSTRRPVETC